MALARTDSLSELDLLAIVCLLPSLLYVIVMFVYPFLYGVYASLQPLKGEAWSIKNYVSFFTDPYQYTTIKTTFALALPNSVVVVLLALFLPTACGAASGWNAQSPPSLFYRFRSASSSCPKAFSAFTALMAG